MIPLAEKFQQEFGVQVPETANLAGQENYRFHLRIHLQLHGGNLQEHAIAWLLAETQGDLERLSAVGYALDNECSNIASERNALRNHELGRLMKR